MSIAIQRRLSLKEAFVRLQPWSETRVHDAEMAADMFNLKTHRDTEELENYEEI